MSDAERKPADPTWLLKASIIEWQRELDSLCQLRMMLAGIALRHAMNPEIGNVNEGLGADIGAAQAALQQSIDRVSETVAALRDLQRVIDGKPPLTTATKETLH